MTLKVKEKPKPKPKQPTDKILIQGIVTVWQGESKDKKILIRKAENHWVDGGLKGLLSTLVGYWATNEYAWAYQQKMYLGSNTTTATTHGMAALQTPIGTAPGTAPNTIYGINRSNPTTGQWKTGIVAVWDRGTISGTVGELALYWRPRTNLTPNWSDSGYTRPQAMVSRLSSAGGDFTSFSIDTTKSLTVQWEITISFA